MHGIDFERTNKLTEHIIAWPLEFIKIPVPNFWNLFMRMPFASNPIFVEFITSGKWKSTSNTKAILSKDSAWT